jgi:hypothetical protein
MDNSNNSQIQKVLLELDNFMMSDLYALYKETMGEIEEGSKVIAMEACKMDDILEREQHMGATRAFNRGANIFDEIATELNNALKEDDE